MNIKFFALIPLFFVLAACSSNPVPKPPGPNDSIVFGYIDMEEASPNLQWVSIRQFSPAVGFWNAGVSKGIFFNWYLKKGSYAVTSFGGNTRRTRYSFNIPRQLTEMRWKIKEPGIHFLGSYKYVHIRTKGLLTPNKFDLEKVESPTEKELVEKLLKVVKGTAVEPKLKAHLKEMK